MWPGSAPWLSVAVTVSLLVGFPFSSYPGALRVSLTPRGSVAFFAGTGSPSWSLSIGEFHDLILWAHLLHSPHPPSGISSMLSVLIIIYVLMTLEFISPVQTLLCAPGHKLSCLFHILTWPSPGTEDSAWPQTELPLSPCLSPPPAFPVNSSTNPTWACQALGSRPLHLPLPCHIHWASKCSDSHFQMCPPLSLQMTLRSTLLQSWITSGASHFPQIYSMSYPPISQTVYNTHLYGNFKDSTLASKALHCLSLTFLGLTSHPLPCSFLPSHSGSPHLSPKTFVPAFALSRIGLLFLPPFKLICTFLDSILGFGPRTMSCSLWLKVFMLEETEIQECQGGTRLSLERWLYGNTPRLVSLQLSWILVER